MVNKANDITVIATVTIVTKVAQITTVIFIEYTYNISAESWLLIRWFLKWQ